MMSHYRPGDRVQVYRPGVPGRHGMRGTVVAITRAVPYSVRVDLDDDRLELFRDVDLRPVYGLDHPPSGADASQGGASAPEVLGDGAARLLDAAGIDAARVADEVALMAVVERETALCKAVEHVIAEAERWADWAAVSPATPAARLQAAVYRYRQARRGRAVGRTETKETTR